MNLPIWGGAFDFLLRKSGAFDERKHPRHAKGSGENAGQFAPKNWNGQPVPSGVHSLRLKRGIGLYHVTGAENLASIRKEGLRFGDAYRGGNDYPNDVAGVFFGKRGASENHSTPIQRKRPDWRVPDFGSVFTKRHGGV